MQQTHLTAWQAHAPWPKRSQIEQDLRLSRGVAALFTDDVLRSHLAMRGGTVLHKAHLAPAARYSEDIDLVLTKPMDTAALEKNLLRVLTPILGVPAPSIFQDAWLALRNASKRSKILSIKFKFVPLGLSRYETIKVDINLNEHQALYPLVQVNLQSLDEEGELVMAPAISYDINEMLGTKTRALMQRQQGLDLFDLWFAWSQSHAGSTPYTVDGKRAMEALSGTWPMRAPQWDVKRPGNCWRNACEILLSAKTWTRCCDPACPGLMWMWQPQQCAAHTLRISPHRKVPPM
jgi:hypothetical protein